MLPKLAAIEAELTSIARLFSIAGRRDGEHVTDYASRIIADATFPQNYLREILDLKAHAQALCAVGTEDITCTTT